MTTPPTFKFALREDIKDDKRFLPTKGEPLATGWDVRAALNPNINEKGNDLLIYPGEYVKIPLGFRTFCPEGWWFELRPRSSTHGKKNLHCLYGVVDESYSGELILSVQYLPSFTVEEISITGYDEDIYGDKESHELLNPNASFKEVLVKSDKYLYIEHGEALGQIIPVKRQDMKVEDISNAELDRLCAERGASRGAGGFGSTSK